jgi:hypothetical protein
MVAHKHGINSGQYYAWRQQLLLRGARGAASETTSSLVRVEVTTVSCLASAIPASVERGVPALPIVPTLPGQPDADIVGPDGVSAPVDGDCGAEDAPTTNRRGVLSSQLAV